MLTIFYFIATDNKHFAHSILCINYFHQTLFYISFNFNCSKNIYLFSSASLHVPWSWKYTMTVSTKTSRVPSPKSTTYMNMYTLTINMLYGVGERERDRKTETERESGGVTGEMRNKRWLVLIPTFWIHTFSMYMCNFHTTQSTDTVFIHKQKHDHISPLTNRGIQDIAKLIVVCGNAQWECY